MPVGCPLCGCEEWARSWAGVTRFLDREFRYRTCRGCGSLYCDPMPSAEVLQAIYGPSYSELVSADHDVEDPKQPQRLLDVAAAVRPGRFVDFGCGSGALLSEMARAGWDVVGVELDPSAARSTSRRTGLKVVPVDEAQDEAGAADIVNLGDVIEHLTEPDVVFRNALSMLAPGGLLVAQGPLENNRTVFGLLRQAAGRLRPGRRRDGVPTHVILATEDGQRTFFRRHGLVPERFDVWEAWWPAPSTVAACERRTRLLALHLARRVSLALGPILPGTWGDRYFYVGRKAAVD